MSNSPSSAIQTAYNGAQGSVLIYQGNYDQAAAFLEHDDENAFSQFRLAYARKKRSAGDGATDLSSVVEFNEPTAEQTFLSLGKVPAEQSRSIGSR